MSQVKNNNNIELAASFDSVVAITLLIQKVVDCSWVGDTKAQAKAKTSRSLGPATFIHNFLSYNIYFFFKGT